MVSWRQMRILFFLPVLMLGVIAVGLYIKNGTVFRRPLVLPFVSTPPPTPSPAVDGATSIVLPDVNPVLHISTPSASIFAPGSSSGEQPTTFTDVFENGYDEYFRTVEKVEHSWISSQPR